MPRLRVFLGAPTARELAVNNEKGAYEWMTVSTGQTGSKLTSVNYTLPPETLEAASQRISKLYESIIFRDDSEGYVGGEFPGLGHLEHTGVWGKSTFITWDYTGDNTADVLSAPDQTSENTFSRSAVSSTGRRFVTQEPTQETESFDYSDASSIARFPSFHFSLHTLTPLNSLRQRANHRGKLSQAYDYDHEGFTASRISILVAILEVEGPDNIRVKKGTDAGKEVSILKLIIGDEDGTICKLTAWREIADRWGGSYPAEDGVKRGDVVLFQNVQLSTSSAVSASDALTLTASPNSSMQICFRTMPLGDEGDSRYRPDLRLGHSDATVRKVSAIVSWFESMAGLPHI